MMGKATSLSRLRWLAVLLLSLLWATTGSTAALAERSDFGHSSLAAKTTVHSTGQHMLPATTVRSIGKGETIASLETELAELTYKSGGLEHAIISLKGGGRSIVSGGR
jgi:hypothetical protein